MPSHRAVSSRGPSRTSPNQRIGSRGHRGGGRHKAVRPAGRRPVVLSATFGLLALAAAAVCTLAQEPAGANPSTADGRGAPPMALGARLGADDALYTRGVPRLSRDEGRVAPTGGSPAEQRAETREAALASTETKANSYASKVDERSWVLPTSRFHISTWFGEAGWYWASGYHTGIDFVAACGTPEVAVTAGRVTRAGWDGAYGYQVRLRLPGGDQVWYNHLTEIRTRVGAELRKGDPVGLMGETGNAYGCHLHFEYRRHTDLEKAVDPAPYFAEHGIDLHALQRRLSAAKR